MKKILTELCLIMGMISVINPMIAEAQSADNYPFDQPGQPLKLNLPKGLTEKIEQGNFIPGKTPPDQIKTWLDSANSEDTHLIALQYLDLSHSDSQTIIANVLQTGSEKEIGFLGQKLLKQNKSNAQNVIMTAYPLAANKVQKQALLSLLGSTKAPEAWPLLLTYYLKLGKEINFLSPQNDANDILYLNQLAKMMRNYPSNELIKDLSPLLGKDFTTQILALKLLYPLNYAPTIDILRRTLEQSDSEQVKSILREIFLIPSSTIIYSMGRRIPNFDIEPVSDREIFTLLLKNYTQGIIDEINPQGEPFISLMSQSLDKNPDFITLLPPYLRQPELMKSIKDPLYNLYIQYKTLEKSDLDLLQISSPDSLRRFVYQYNSHPEQLKGLFSELISSKYPPVITATLQIFKKDPEAFPSAQALTHHPDEEVRTAAWSLIGAQRPDQLRSLANDALGQETSPKVKAEILRALLINNPAVEQVQFAIDHLLATEDANLTDMLKKIFSKSYELSKEDQAQGIEKLSPLLKRSSAVQASLLDVYLQQGYLPPAKQLQPIIAAGESGLTDQTLNLIRVVAPAWEEYGSLIEPVLASKDRQLALSALEAWDKLRYQSPEGWQSPLLQRLAATETDAFLRNKILEVALSHGVSLAEPFLLQTVAEQAASASSTRYSEINLNNVRQFKQAQALLPFLNGSENKSNNYYRFNPENFLKQYGSDELLPELKRLLPTFNEEGQSSIIRILGQLGDRSTLEWVRPFLNSANKSLQSAARDAFLQLGGKFSPAEAQTILTDEDPDVEKIKWPILAELPQELSYPLLRSDMRSLDARRRANAIQFAVALNARALLPEMLNAMGDNLIRDYAMGCLGFPERSGTLMSLLSLTDESNYGMFLEFLAPDDLQRLNRGSRSAQQEIFDRLEPEKILNDFAAANQDQRAKMINLFADSLDPAWKPILLKVWHDEQDPELKERLLAMLGELKSIEVQPVLLSHMTQNHLALSYLAYMRHPEAKEYLLKLYLEDPKAHAWTLSLLRLYLDKRIARIFTDLKHSEDPTIRRQMSDLENYPVPSFVKFPHSWQSESIHSPRRPFEETYTFAELLEQIQHFDLDKTHERMLPLARTAKNPDQKQLAERVLSTFLDSSVKYPPMEAANALIELGTPAAQARLLKLFLQLRNTYQPQFISERLRDYLLHMNLQTLEANIQTLIPQVSPDEEAELRLLHVLALGLQHKAEAALTEINQLKDDPLFHSHPARMLKLIHLQSDFIPAQERETLLNQDADKLLENFTAREHKLYPDAGLNHQIRKRLAQLQTGQTTPAREQLAKMFTEQMAIGQIDNLSASAPLIQFMIAESLQMDQQTEQAVQHLLHGLRLMRHGAGGYSGMLNVQGLESLPFQASFSSEFAQLMKLLASEPERQTYFKEYFTYPAWYPASLASLFSA